jgi:hypothetical protein
VATGDRMLAGFFERKFDGSQKPFSQVIPMAVAHVLGGRRWGDLIADA